MEDIPPQFFTVDAAGNSAGVTRTVQNNTELLRESAIKARNRQSYTPIAGNSVNMDGIPGVPFERGIPNPDLFYQGEDIIYDMYLTYDGVPVSSDKFNITVYIKPSNRAYNTAWAGTFDGGVYKPDNADPGYYEVWIPSADTSNLYAGTYYLQVQLQEKVGTGSGRFDRRHVVLQTYFNLEYSNFSPAPESSSTLSTKTAERAAMELTWPNKPSTVNRNPSQGSTSVPIQPGWDPMSIQ
jgi:hypothetical protein